MQPNSPAAQFDFGLAQLKEKKYEEGNNFDRKALELKPEWADAYNNLGLAYAGLSRWKEAVTAYREAVRLVPDYAGALYNLGIAYLRLGQKSATLEVIAKVRPLNWDLQARLWQEILTIERPASVVAVPAPIPTVPPRRKHRCRKRLRKLLSIKPKRTCLRTVLKAKNAQPNLQTVWCYADGVHRGAASSVVHR